MLHILLTTLAGLSPALATAPSERPAVPNVLVVVWDDVGWDDVARDVFTPNLDALRRQGRTLARFYTQPLCSPTRASLMYGEYGFRTGVGEALRVDSSVGFTPPVERNSLPGLLKNHGIRTGLIGKWHLSNEVGGVRDEAPRLHGFGSWNAGAAGNFRPGEDYGESLGSAGWDRVDDGVLVRESAYATTAQTDAAILWWGEHLDERKFLVVAYNSAHDPYHDPPLQLVPRPSRKQGNRRIFENMVQSLDVETGRLLAAVDLRDTLVFVMSDNGTPAAVVDVDQDPDKVKGTIYEGGIRVPCVVAGAGISRSGPAGGLAHAADLYATVCEAMDVPVPPGLAQDSVSLLPLLQRDEEVRTFCYSQRFRPGGFDPQRTTDERAVVGPRYKLHIVDGLEFLYDLVKDPTESSPLDLTDPKLRKKLEFLRKVALDLEG